MPGGRRLFRPGLTVLWILARSRFDVGGRRNIEASVAQTGGNVLVARRVVAENMSSICPLAAARRCALGRARAIRPRWRAAQWRGTCRNEPCSFATSRTNQRSRARHDSGDPLRTMRASCSVSASQSHPARTRAEMLETRKASSKLGPCDSITLQAKPAKTRAGHSAHAVVAEVL